MRRRGFFREHSSVSVALYAIVDLVMVVLGAVIAYACRFGTLDIAVQYRAPIFIALLLVMVIFPALGLYESWRGRSAVDHLRTVLFGWGAVVLGLVLIGFMLKESGNFSRLWFGAWALLSGAFLTLGRTMASLTLRWLRVRGLNQRRIFIVGTGPVAQDVVRQVHGNPSSGWVITAAMAIKPYNLDDLQLGDVSILEHSNDVERLVRRLRIDEVWLCLPLEEQTAIEQTLWDLRHSTATLRLVPNLRGIRLIQHPVEEVLGIPMLNLSVSPIQGLNRLIKAIEDRVLALLILTLISPVFLILALGVKFSSPGPIFFRQKRVSWNGKPFTILKFRSMPTDAEERTGPTWAHKGEKRATRFGHFLRRTSLDELPQFINVLRGDMSIVGPRPERPVFVERFKNQIPDYMRKHLVKAGITGWAQIHGWRGDTDLKKRIEHDLYYIENWSLWLDLKIILLTIFKGFYGPNAY